MCILFINCIVLQSLKLLQSALVRLNGALDPGGAVGIGGAGRFEPGEPVPHLVKLHLKGNRFEQPFPIDGQQIGCLLYTSRCV